MRVSWPVFKTFLDRGLSAQEVTAEDDQVWLEVYDGNLYRRCRLHTLPDVEPAITYWNEYVNNYQASSNKPISVVDHETGGYAYSPKYAPDGFYQKQHEFEFTVNKLDSVEDEKADLTDYNYSVLKFYNSAGTELTTQGDIDTSGVITTLEWTPVHDIRILSGHIQQINTPTTRIKVWGIGSPYYANRTFVDGVNLEFEPNHAKIGLDGVAGSTLPYTLVGPGVYANTIRFKVWTPDSPGVQHRIQAKLNMFVPDGC